MIKKRDDDDKKEGSTGGDSVYVLVAAAVNECDKDTVDLVEENTTNEILGIYYQVLEIHVLRWEREGSTESLFVLRTLARIEDMFSRISFVKSLAFPFMYIVLFGKRDVRRRSIPFLHESSNEESQQG